MKWMGVNEIREKYQAFFESKGHKRLPSFPLVPQDDASLLLINSGMAPMKKYFTGQITPPAKRVTTCQKCIRTPDIERVGKTSRHGTYFEMLGNFSFGDYFKRDAIPWAWEFLTEWMGIPAEMLYVSTFTDDEEARTIWREVVGVPEERMVILGREDNFWEIGLGPCGPCSEIYVDRGAENGCGSPDCKPGCDCDRFVEIWNLVFTQFDSDGNGNYTPLEHPNIDTGMGLERLACVIQGVGNLFEVDTVQNIIGHVGNIAGVSYRRDDRTDVSLRVIADHIRSTTFLVADGVIPQNEGRGYVLRRLLRRAARHGRLLGIKRPFLYEVVDTVIDENLSGYPELAEKRGYIKKIVQTEEQSFLRTIDKGMELLAGMLERIRERAVRFLSGEEAFKLYDTFGFPIDLIREIVQEYGMMVEEEGFERLMKEQRERARAARAKTDEVAWVAGDLTGLPEEPQFVGYEQLSVNTAITAILGDGGQVSFAEAGETVGILLGETPFYAESGGQVGDTGLLQGENGTVEITGAKALPTGHSMAIGTVTSGVITVGDMARAKVDADRRGRIMRNHSATHLLQTALREVLGDHVHQAGSYVDERRLRFDFSHFSAMTPEEIRRVEADVNRRILEGVAADIREMPIEEAKKQGAMALFGEKYADVVRVVRFGEHSTELCGGTHVDNTAKIGLFTVISESSVAAGVRRIEGTTGLGVLEQLYDAKADMTEAALSLRAAGQLDLKARAMLVAAELRQKDRRIEELEGQLADLRVSTLIANAKEADGVSIMVAELDGLKPEILRITADRIRDRLEGSVVFLSSQHDGKTTLITSCGKAAQALGLHAGKLMKELAGMAGGSGGGKAESAMGGAGDREKLKSALEGASQVIHGMLKK